MSGPLTLQRSRELRAALNERAVRHENRARLLRAQERRLRAWERRQRQAREVDR